MNVCVLSDSTSGVPVMKPFFLNFPQHQKEKGKNIREETIIINHFTTNSADREPDLNFDIQFSRPKTLK